MKLRYLRIKRGLELVPSSHVHRQTRTVVIRLHDLVRGIQAIKRAIFTLAGLRAGFFDSAVRRADGGLCILHFGRRRLQPLIKAGSLFDQVI